MNPLDHALSYDELNDAAKESVAALLAMGKAVDASGLEKTLTELIKLRVSNLNECAFCIGFHLMIARKLNIPARKLDYINAWHDVSDYTPRERAALRLADHLTHLPTKPLTEAEALAIRAEFTPSEIVHLHVAIANINAWNRLGVGLPLLPLS